MHPDNQTPEWEQYFSDYPGQHFLTLRLPGCKTRQHAYTACRDILLDLSRTLKTEISAIGVFVGSDKPSERHCHFIVDSDQATLHTIDNRPDSNGRRPALPLSRKHRHLDHQAALEISPIDDRAAVNVYMAQNLVNSRHPATDVIQFNQRRLILRQAA